MTPENDNAQDRALEALVAASLRAPGEQSDVTESEIRRFVEQRVTLSVEDEAALIKAKPSLKKQIHELLQQTARNAATVEPEIPKSLLTLGAKKHLMPPQMRTLLNMRLQIIGHRCDSGDSNLESFDWERFYDRVKEYLQ